MPELSFEADNRHKPKMVREEDAMINIDLSKVRLPDWATYFLGVVPGLIFEAAVLIRAQFVRECLRIATRQLLRTRYGINVADSPLREAAVPPSAENVCDMLGETRGAAGIEPQPPGVYWDAWFRALDKPPRYFLQGQRLMRISLASGLAGFLALLFRPSLSKWYFRAACTVFSFTGLLIMWRQAEWKADPDKQNFLMLQSALSDLAEARGAIPAEADKEA